MSDLYSVLLEIKEDIGAIRATTEATSKVLAQHVEDDKKLTERVLKMELAQAKTKGSAKAWASMGAVGGAVLGYLATFFAGSMNGH